MVDGEECGLCNQTLDEACRRFGQDYCALRHRYKTTGMTTAELTAELVDRLDPDQVRTIRQALIDRGVATAG